MLPEIKIEITRQFNERGYAKLEDIGHRLRFFKENFGSIRIKVFSDWMEVCGDDYLVNPYSVGVIPRKQINLKLKPIIIAKRIIKNIVDPHEILYVNCAAIAEKKEKIQQEIDETLILLEKLTDLIIIACSDYEKRRFMVTLKKGALTIEEFISVAEILKEKLGIRQ